MEEIVLYPNSGLNVEFVLADKLPGTVQGARLMIKERLDQEDALALIDLAITASAGDEGVVTVAPTSELYDGDEERVLLVFTITPAQTSTLVAGRRLVAALKVFTVDGGVYSPPQGRRAVRVDPAGVYSTTL